MLNNVKYKSSLTLTLQTPLKSTSQHSIQECFNGDDHNDDDVVVDDTIVRGNVCDINCFNDEMHQFIVVNSNHLSNMSRTYNRNESFSESPSSLSPTVTMPSYSNETIIPIKYLIHDERTDYNNQIDMGKMAEISSPKYCCTLEVKFVW